LLRGAKRPGESPAVLFLPGALHQYGIAAIKKAQAAD
jgi:hypothetical protein